MFKIEGESEGDLRWSDLNIARRDAPLLRMTARIVDFAAVVLTTSAVLVLLAMPVSWRLRMGISLALFVEAI